MVAALDAVAGIHLYLLQMSGMRLAGGVSYQGDSLACFVRALQSKRSAPAELRVLSVDTALC